MREEKSGSEHERTSSHSTYTEAHTEHTRTHTPHTYLEGVAKRHELTTAGTAALASSR